MQLTKRNLIKTAAIGSAFVGALAIAAPASANTFDFTVAPSNAGSGPTFNIRVNAGETKCVSLARAYEDSAYYYQMNTVHFYHGVALDNFPVYFYS